MLVNITNYINQTPANNVWLDVTQIIVNIGTTASLIYAFKRYSILDKQEEKKREKEEKEYIFNMVFEKFIFNTLPAIESSDCYKVSDDITSEILDTEDPLKEISNQMSIFYSNSQCSPIIDKMFLLEDYIIDTVELRTNDEELLKRKRNLIEEIIKLK